MFAIAFDLTVADAEEFHPKGSTQAYADIGNTLARFGFERIQGSLYVTKNEDLANLFPAMSALRAMAWFHLLFVISARFDSSSGRTSRWS
jgi:virulence-associated protein VapD